MLVGPREKGMFVKNLVFINKNINKSIPLVAQIGTFVGFIVTKIKEY